jgi:hypothetical protein
MYLERSRSQQPVYKGSLPSHSIALHQIHLVQPCLLAILSLAPYISALSWGWVRIAQTLGRIRVALY